MKAAFDLVRRARLAALLDRQLSNGGEVWSAYRSAGAIPPLRFRNGLTLWHGDGDAPVFLFLEIFANGCCRRLIDPTPPGDIVDIGANIGAFTLECAASVKIDVEGAEADILEGGRGTLRAAAQFVGEYHEDRVPGVAARCRAILEANGFDVAAAVSRRCGPTFHARRIDA